MTWTIRRAAQGAVLSLLCVTVASVPGVGGGSSRATVPLAAAAPSELEVETADPAPVPAASEPPAKLLVGELALQPVPMLSGPSTRIPILLYHYIRVNPNPRDRVGFNLSTPPAMFRAQMQYLSTQGFHVLSLHDAVMAIAHHRPLPSRPVVLTFDDGYADFATAAIPIMQGYGFTGTDFVISGRIGVPGFLSATQIKEADRLGFTIGAHTVHHYALAALTPARVSWEMRQSKLALEALLGHPVVDFAYPYGSYSQEAVGEARRLGFECAASTLVGSVHTGSQLMLLSRIRVGGAMSLSTFAHLVGGPVPSLAGPLSIATAPSPAPGT